MKVNANELERLLQIQRDIFAQRKLVAQAGELKSGTEIDAAQAALSTISEQLSTQRIQDEELKRDLKKLENDVELVQKRLETDEKRLNESSSSKDIAGIQSEIEALKARRSRLEDEELELMEAIELSAAELSRLESAREQAEADLQLAKDSLQQQLGSLKEQSQVLVTQIEGLKGQVDTELLGVFEAKLVKGVGVGRLQGSACTACNMSLNSTAMSEVVAVPSDELCTCPECGAIMVRG